MMTKGKLLHLPPLNLVASYLSIFCFQFFLFSNILELRHSYATQGTGYVYLIFAFGLSLFVILRLSLCRQLAIRRHFFYLFAFLAYFIVSSTIYHACLDMKQLFVGTTGGVVFFLFSGMALYACVSVVFAYRSILSIFYIITMLVMVLYVLIMFLPLVRTDIFLVTTVHGNYQRAGDFLIISSLLMGYMLFSPKLRGSYFNLIVLLFTVFIMMVIAQMIGSNTALVCLVFIALAVLLVYYLTDNVLGGSHSIIGFIKYKTFWLVVLSVSSLLLLLIISALLFYSLKTGHVPNIRVFNFGATSALENSSITSRLEILHNNFMIQFNLSPIFGNMCAEVVTTGIGSYPHSVLFSLLTKLGVIGLLLFTILFFSLLTVRRSMNRAETFSVITLIGLIGYGIIATIFSWAVLWFAIGLLGGYFYISCYNIRKK